MATVERKKRPEVVAKPEDPFVHFVIDCAWTLPILGVAPARPTMPDHLAKTLEDDEARIRREAKRQRPSEVLSGENGENGEEGESIDPLLTEREKWCREALEDPMLDDDAKATIIEAFRVRSPGEKAAQIIMRATNTFYRHPQNNHLVVPAKWFRGGLKAALQNDLGYYQDRAQRAAKGCITILPPYLDLNTAKEDAVVNANVPLPTTPGREAQATIKRFRLVDPAKHNVEHFRLLVRVLDAPFAQEIVLNLHRLMIVVGASGVGGDHPNYGTFDVTDFQSIKREEAQEILQTLLEAPSAE